MRMIAFLLASAILAAPAFAEDPIQRSSSPSGIQVQGNTSLKAEQDVSVAVAVGRDNSSKNTAAAVKDGVQIQGDTKINAKQKNTSSTTFGKNNTASNEAGVIGGK